MEELCALSERTGKTLLGAKSQDSYCGMKPGYGGREAGATIMTDF